MKKLHSKILFDIVQICTNLHSVYTQILINLLFFCTINFNPLFFFSSEQIRDLQRVSTRHYTSFMYNSWVSSLFLEKVYKKVNTVALERLNLINLFLLIKTTSGANGSIKVGKLYNQLGF